MEKKNHLIEVIKFYEAYCNVEPKREALEEANNQLADAKHRLSKLLQVAAWETLTELTMQYEETMEETA